MKLIICGIPNITDENELSEAFAIFAQRLGMNLKFTVLDQNEILPQTTTIFSKPKESEFIQAVKKIHETFGDIVRDVSARAEFYDAIIRNRLQSPILNAIVMGPKDPKELHALKDMGGNEYMSIIKTALSLSESIHNGKDI